MAEWNSIAWIGFSGLIFAVSHSLLASVSCKAWMYRHGLPEPRYRLLYSVFALLVTGAWMFFVHALPDAPLYHSSGMLSWLLMMLQLTGLLVALAAFQPIDALVFLGLRKAPLNTDPFVVSGIYRWLRHPMYAGVMLMLLAMPVQSWNGLSFVCIVCAYFIIGSRFEEQRMLRAHSNYTAYRDRVAAFIPSVPRKMDR